MIKPGNIIWYGKPQYVFKISILESNSHRDIKLPHKSPIAIFIFATMVFCTISYEIDGSRGFLICLSSLVTLGAFIPDLFIWNRISKRRYTLSEENLTIDAKTRLAIEQIKLGSISNIYTVDENKKYESIIITHQAQDGKVLTSKLHNIAKKDDLKSVIMKLKKRSD